MPSPCPRPPDQSGAPARARHNVRHGSSGERVIPKKWLVFSAVLPTSCSIGNHSALCRNPIRSARGIHPMYWSVRPNVFTLTGPVRDIRLGGVQRSDWGRRVLYAMRCRDGQKKDRRRDREERRYRKSNRRAGRFNFIGIWSKLRGTRQEKGRYVTSCLYSFFLDSFLRLFLTFIIAATGQTPSTYKLLICCSYWRHSPLTDSGTRFEANSGAAKQRPPHNLNTSTRGETSSRAIPNSIRISHFPMSCLLARRAMIS